MYQRGDEWLINTRWEQVVGMRDQLTFLEIVTWYGIDLPLLCRLANHAG